MGQLFAAYGDNVLIKRLEQKGDTCRGMVIHSGHFSLKHGDMVLYGYSDWMEIDLFNDEYNEQTIDCLWRPKVRCILVDKEVE